jgi:hypothetical protein
MTKCVVCGEETNPYVNGQPTCSRCDRQAQTVQWLRRTMDEQAKRGERPSERSSRHAGHEFRGTIRRPGGGCRRLLRPNPPAARVQSAPREEFLHRCTKLLLGHAEVFAPSSQMVAFNIAVPDAQSAERAALNVKSRSLSTYGAFLHKCLSTERHRIRKNGCTLARIPPLLT